MSQSFSEDFEKIIGRRQLRTILMDLEVTIQKSQPRLELVSNPVMRYIRDTTALGSRRIFYNQRSPRPLDDAYFRLTSRLIQLLENELNDNSKYKKQCLSKILSRDEGPFLSAFAELVCAGFLKSTGQQVSFNSSAEAGLPDIISTKNSVSLGHDAKLFADEDILFIAKVNRMLPDFARDYRTINNITLQATIFDIKSFNAKRLKLAIENFLAGKRASTDGIWITSFDYKEDRGIEVNLKENNFSLRIIPSQPLDQAVANFAKSLTYSVEQIKKAGQTQGVSWGFFTHDDGYGSKQTIVQKITDIVPQYMKSGFGLVLMEIRPTVYKGDLTIKCQVFEIGMPKEIRLTQRRLEIFLDSLNIKD